VRLRIGAHVRQPERGVTLDLDIAGGDLAAAFRRRRQDQVGGGHRRHFGCAGRCGRAAGRTGGPDTPPRSAYSARVCRRNQDRWRGRNGISALPFYLGVRLIKSLETKGLF
jgi:hypothetical protein